MTPYLHSLLHPMQVFNDLAPLFISTLDTSNSNTKRLRGRSRGYISIDENEHSRRLADDDSVDYWRKRAGWFDDDESMANYNAGVYDTYYSVDDDGGGSSGGGSSSSASGASWYSTDNKHFWSNMITVIVGLISVVVFILLARAIRRRISPSDSPSKSRKSTVHSSRDDTDLRSRRRSASRSTRSRSKSRTRSRSRSRARSHSRARHSRSDADDGNYKLMEDEPPKRDKSRTRSSRSRSRSRKKVEEMLV